MLTKIATETLLARVLANTSLQIEMSLLTMGTHETTHTDQKHLSAFYKTIDEIKNNFYDGMILFRWRGHASLLFSNWLNYYVYQDTPYDISELKK